MQAIRSSKEIIQQMQSLVLPGSPEPKDLQILAQLRSLTQELIQSYQKMGRLQDDPFGEARTRPVQLFEAEVRARLQGQVVLVTGGEGYVGGRLITRLLELGVDRVVSIDKARGCQVGSEVAIVGSQPNVKLYTGDVRELKTLRSIFAAENPTIVFHVAAQRLPGLAEKEIRETATSNVFGTQNVIQVCEEFGVQQCVFSSTGKASRYFTAEVYAASKKMAEWLFAEAAQRGKVCCSMVRFTHMLENSSMCQQIDEKVQQCKPVNIHAPDRYVAGQNVGEAVHLLLNSLALAEPGRLKFNLVRHLGWPTESLEVALYKILRSGQDLPIYFQGVLPGYEESFFLGQVDWDDQIDINTLINALETAYNSTISPTGDMIVAELMAFSTSVLQAQLAHLKTLCEDLSQPETQIKQGLAIAVREVTRSTFLQTSPQKLLRILKWGVNPKQFHCGELRLESYQEVVELLVQSLVARLTIEGIHSSSLSLQEFVELTKALMTLPSIRAEVEQLQAIVHSAIEPQLTPKAEKLAL